MSLKDLPSPYRHNGEKYVGPTGPIWPRFGAGIASDVPYITDNGFSGAWWRTHWQDDYGATLFTPNDYQGDKAKQLRRQHSDWRQLVETGHLDSVFGLAWRSE